MSTWTSDPETAPAIVDKDDWAAESDVDMVPEEDTMSTCISDPETAPAIVDKDPWAVVSETDKFVLATETNCSKLELTAKVELDTIRDIFYII